jgi:hypothetical protein
MIKEWGVKNTRELFDREYTKRDLAQATGYEVGKTNADAMVYGSAVLGPKIGMGFYQNLNGNFKPLTMDMWFMRAWGRMTGTGIGQADMGPVTDRLRNALKDESKRAPTNLDALQKIATKIVDQHEQDYKDFRAEYNSGKRDKSELVHAAERFDHNYGGAMVEAAARGGKQRAWITDVFNKPSISQGRRHRGPRPLLPSYLVAPEQLLYKHLGAVVKQTEYGLRQGVTRHQRTWPRRRKLKSSSRARRGSMIPTNQIA